AYDRLGLGPAQLALRGGLVGRLPAAHHADRGQVALFLLPAHAADDLEGIGQLVAGFGLGARGPDGARLVLAVRGRRRGREEIDEDRGLVVAVLVVHVGDQRELRDGPRRDAEVRQLGVYTAVQVAAHTRSERHVNAAHERRVLGLLLVGELEGAPRVLREGVVAAQEE